MGCITKIIRITILILAIIGLIKIGGPEFFQNKILPLFSPSQEKLKEKAAQVADLSNVSDEYEINRTAFFLGYKAIMAEHKATGQKFAILQPKDQNLLTKKDFQDGSADKKIKEFADKFQYQYIHLENINLKEHGVINASAQSIPYARFDADVVNFPVQGVQGIIGALTGKDGKNQIIISFSQYKKYSQIITEEFFKKIK